MVQKNCLTFGNTLFKLKNGHVLVRILESEFFLNCNFDMNRQGGPGPRSCHKVCFDEKTLTMYVLGRYVDPESRPNIPLENDFWKYDTQKDKWDLISDNTHVNDLFIRLMS